MRVNPDGTPQTDVVLPVELGAEVEDVTGASVACPREDDVREACACGAGEDCGDLGAGEGFGGQVCADVDEGRGRGVTARNRGNGDCQVGFAGFGGGRVVCVWLCCVAVHGVDVSALLWL